MRRPSAALVICSITFLSSTVGQAKCVNDDIRPSVCALTGRFDANPAGRYKSPVCATLPLTDERAVAIQDAYKYSPPGLRRELCQLKKILILPPEAAYDFGFYENPISDKWPDDGSYPGAIIGVREDHLRRTLVDEENALLWPILKNNADARTLAHHEVTKADGTAVDDATGRKLGLMATLAHEIGHIKWHRDNVAISLDCYRDSFVEKSWSSQDLPQSLKKRWAPFNDRSGVHKKATPHPHDNFLDPQTLRQIYDNRDRNNVAQDGFVSAFASISPEEDFVETFKMASLRNSVDNNLPIDFLITLALSDKTFIDVKNNTNDIVVEKRDICVEPLVK